MENGFDISYLIPGTDGPTIAWYRGLPQRAQESFELLEDEVVVVDTETTGLDPSRDQLIEIAACILRGPEVVEHFQTFVNPGRPIPAEITELTGITQEDVDGAPDPSLAVELFATWADGRDLVAHNASFDKGVIMRQAQPGSITGRWMDSLALSRVVLPRMRGHRLADLSRAFGLHASTHRATDDVEATAGLWRILMAGVYSLPAGMAQLIASLSPQTSWPLRHLFAQAAQMTPGTEDWSLRRSRSRCSGWCSQSRVTAPCCSARHRSPSTPFPQTTAISGARAICARGSIPILLLHSPRQSAPVCSLFRIRSFFRAPIWNPQPPVIGICIAIICRAPVRQMQTRPIRMR